MMPYFILERHAAFFRPRVFCKGRGTTSSGDREARASAADDSLVQKIARNIKGGPASPGTSSVVFDSAGDTLAAGGGHRRSSLQLPGNVKWAPLSTGRRMGVGGDSVTCAI